jgi:hypothetical protein
MFMLLVLKEGSWAGVADWSIGRLSAWSGRADSRRETANRYVIIRRIDGLLI